MKDNKDWQLGEFKQLDRMRILGMFGDLSWLLQELLSFVAIGNINSSGPVSVGPDVAVVGLLGLPPFSIKWHPHIPLVWSSLYSVSSLRLPLPII
jgi:hypothetical protein